MIFNYKNWFHWVYWSIFIVSVTSMINALDTLTRWKWGYFSIDLIPGILGILLCYFLSEYFYLSRMSKRIEKIEDEMNKVYKLKRRSLKGGTNT